MSKNLLLWTAITLWLAPAAALAAALWLTPNIVTRIGNAGDFLSAEVRPGGFGSATVTTIKTTGGSFAVQGIFTAHHGMPLQVRDSTKYGPQLCSRHAPVTCAPIAGHYLGDLDTVAHAPVLTHSMRQTLRTICIVWLFCGFLGVLFVAMNWQ
ncbi:MAG: hypothetical protein L0H29_08205 [Sinobacteraceae bacterium]|nr:hypothetical protein [Nevskiaceae bacterium]